MSDHVTKGYVDAQAPMGLLVDDERAGLVVRDAHGVDHASVVIGDKAFVVAMCDFFASIDAHVSIQRGMPGTPFVYPTRQYPVSDEVEGVISCLVCLGS